MIPELSIYQFIWVGEKIVLPSLQNRKFASCHAIIYVLDYLDGSVDAGGYGEGFYERIEHWKSSVISE